MPDPVLKSHLLPLSRYPFISHILKSPIIWTLNILKDWAPSGLNANNFSSFTILNGLSLIMWPCPWVLNSPFKRKCREPCGIYHNNQFKKPVLPWDHFFIGLFSYTSNQLKWLSITINDYQCKCTVFRYGDQNCIWLYLWYILRIKIGPML